MPVIAGKAEVACPACEEDVTVELHIAEHPRMKVGGPMDIMLVPDMDAIRHHLGEAHLAGNVRA